jgi:peroxiredoxin/mono/diheme cytochrome c family protein
MPQVRPCLWPLFLLVALGVGGSRETQASDADTLTTSTIVGRTLGEYRLTDFRGQEVADTDFSKAKVLVIAFLGVECPLAKLYTDRLQAIFSDYKDRGVMVLGVDANQQDSLVEMAAHARKHGISFPFVKDNLQELVRSLGATRTPEVFVLDNQRVVRYYGRVDDQYGVGFVREAPTTNDLRDAVECLLNNQAIEVVHRPAPGCLIGRIKQPNPDAKVTYSNQIARIFSDHCVRCHRQGEIGPFAMTDYDEVVGWAEMIQEVVQQRRMPPWHANGAYGKFANDCSLTDADRDLIEQWVAEGAPEGDRSQLPEPKQYVVGWQLPRQPDVVFDISPEPFTIPADGEVKYQYFRVDPKFTEEKWISCAQLLPGNRSVVHHILAFARPKGARGGIEGQRGFLVGYVPGSLAEQFPEGIAKRIPANSELIFQVHYTPIGTAQKDQSKLGIIFADPSTLTHEVMTTSAVQTRLRIPPNESNYEVSAMLPEELPECRLLTMAPHMHLRGKSFRYTAVYPGGKREILLDVPAYDFNWQTGYRLAEPLQLPRGTKIFCEASFDNSSANLNNPAPTQWVKWGDQTYDEMMIGYFDIIVPLAGDSKSDTGGINRKQALVEQLIREGLFERLDKNNDKRVERSEVPARLMDRFEEFDANSDGVLTLEEFERKR